MKNQIEVIIADDHPLMIDGIKTALTGSSEINIIGEAKNGFETIELVNTKKPDIVLLDIRMPGLDGLDALKIIKTDHPETKVIMFSQFSERGLIKKSIEYGADGYLLKDCEKNTLINTIKKVVSGGIFFEIYGFTSKLYNKSSSDCKLSSREIEVLQLICKEFTSKEIAEKLNISIDTVCSFRARLMKKTGAKNIIGLFKWVLDYNPTYLDRI